MGKVKELNLELVNQQSLRSVLEVAISATCIKALSRHFHIGSTNLFLQNKKIFNFQPIMLDF